jgi:hypothetical protein
MSVPRNLPVASMAHDPNIPLSQDAALVVALVGTAMPFARSAEDEAERWLRALRLHGQVGGALQALGVGEAPLTPGSDFGDASAGATPPLGAHVLQEVTSRATELATLRGAETVGTADLLYAVMDVYGDLFDRLLYIRGTSRDELGERLASAGSRSD